MKKILFLPVFLLFGYMAIAGELSYSPDKPMKSSELRMLYKADAVSDSVYAVLYSFSSKTTLPTAIDIKLEQTAGSSQYSKSIQLPEGIEFGLFKILKFNKGKMSEDNNFRAYFKLFVYEADGKAVKNSYKHAAVSYMGNVSGLNMNADFNLALDYLKQENALYPGDQQAEIGLTALLFDLGKINQKDFESRMKASLDKTFDITNEADVSARIRGLNMLNRKDEADALLEKFAETNPTSSLVEDQIMNKISAATDLYKFAKYADIHLRYFPNSNRHSMIAKAIVNAYLQNAEYGQLMSFLKDHQIESPDILLAISSSIKFDKNILKNLTPEQRSDSAISVYNRCNELFAREYFQKAERKPYYISKLDFYEAQNMKYALISEEGGNMMVGDNQETAIILYEKALGLYAEKAPGTLYNRIVDILTMKENLPQALNYVTIATLNSAFYDGMDVDYKDLYVKINSVPEQTATAEYAKLLDSARKIRLGELKEQEIRAEYRDSYLKSMDDQLLDLNDLHGKTVILYFMSSWAGPCQAAVPAIEEIAAFYKADPNVAFIAVDIWEKEKDRTQAIKDFITEYTPEYPIYYDALDIIPRNMSVSGLPTIVMLDAKGTMRFKMSGFNSADDYIRNVNDMVDYLVINK
ncbi:MAG: TlpA disulfide reductase family protein [bacterium]